MRSNMIDLVKATEAKRATPEDVAEAFADMDSVQQRQFFNHLAEVVAEWPGGGFNTQLAWVSAQRGKYALTPAARRLMFTIGDYADVRLRRSSPSRPTASSTSPRTSAKDCCPCSPRRQSACSDCVRWSG